MSLNDDILALQQIDLLQGFDRDQLRLAAFGSERVSYREGEMIFRQGQRTDAGYLILTGSVNLGVAKDGELVSKGDFGPGSVLGEMAMITRTDRGYTAIANEDCILLKVSHNTIHRVLIEYPELAVKLHNRISKKVMNFADELPAIQDKLMRHDD